MNRCNPENPCPVETIEGDIMTEQRLLGTECFCDENPLGTVSSRKIKRLNTNKVPILIKDDLGNNVANVDNFTIGECQEKYICDSWNDNLIGVGDVFIGERTNIPIYLPTTIPQTRTPYLGYDPNLPDEVNNRISSYIVTNCQETTDIDIECRSRPPGSTTIVVPRSTKASCLKNSSTTLNTNGNGYFRIGACQNIPIFNYTYGNPCKNLEVSPCGSYQENGITWYVFPPADRFNLQTGLFGGYEQAVEIIYKYTHEGSTYTHKAKPCPY